MGFINIIDLINCYDKSPILLFPGLGGSRLIKYDKNTNNKIEIWPPKINYFLFNYKDWSKNMKINYDDISDKNIYEQNIKPCEFGNKKSLDLHTNLPYIIHKNFYDDVINSYDNIYPIPYDFRLIHIDTYLDDLNNNLSSYIENFTIPVILLTHSCGGIVAHNFLHSKDDKWKEKHIKSVINVNVPFGGLLVTLQESAINSQYNKIIGKDIIQSLGGIIINLPNKDIFNSILKVNGKEIDDYLNYFNLNHIKKMYEKTFNIRKCFDKSNRIKTEIVYTDNIDTPGSLEINDGNINIINTKGDGAVPLFSLLVPKKWNNKNIKFTPINDYTHSEIFFSQQIKNIINEHL